MLTEEDEAYSTDEGFPLPGTLIFDQKLPSLPPHPMEPLSHHRCEEGSLRREKPGVQQQELIRESLEGDSRPLRELPLNLSEKRRIRETQQLTMPECDSWKDIQHRAARRLWERAKETLQYAEMWRGSLHSIEGHFGSGVQSYFSFLRFLVLMNFVTFLLIGGFIVIPNIVFEQLQLKINTTSSVTDGNKMCFVYDPTHRGMVNFYEYVMDLLSGTGYMELTYMFYGFYENTAVKLKAFSYNIPLAYLITTLFYFLFSLVWTVVRSVNRLKQSLVNEDSSLSNYSHKVFVSWDFCISEEQSVRLRQNNLRYELKMDLEEEALQRRQAERSPLQRAWVYTLRAILHLIVMAILAGAFYAIYLATEFSQKLLSENSMVSSNFFLELLVQYLPSIIITAATTILPMIFNIFSLLEKYSLTWEIKLTLIRCVFLRLASLVILLFSLWTQITCSGQKSESNCKNCSYNQKYPCWETRLGQEMYKLAIFDFLTVLVMTLLVDFPRKMIVQHCSSKFIRLLGHQEFQVPSNVLDLIYGQTVCWIGTFYCPLLPLFNTVKYFIIFYLKKMTLLKNCCPAKRTFRASSSNFFFLLVLLFGLALSWVPILYSIFAITPSKACGPFRGQSFIWDTIPSAIQPLPQVAQEFLFFIGSQAFLVPFFLLFCIIISYLMALANSYGQLVKELKVYVQMEGRDKHFLVKQIRGLSEPNEKTNTAGHEEQIWARTIINPLKVY